MKINFTHENYRQRGTGSRDYDVLITLNQSADGKFRTVRFGFTSSALKIPNVDKKYVQVSNVSDYPTRIFFLFTDEPEGQHYKMQKQGGTSRAFCMTPAGKEALILKRDWVSRKFDLRYDPENKCHFIDLYGSRGITR